MSLSPINIILLPLPHPQTTLPQLPLLSNTLQNHTYISLQYHPPTNNLIQNIMHFIRVEDQIKFADVAETFVEGLDEDLD